MSRKRVAIYCRVAGPDNTGTAMFMQHYGLRLYAEEQGHDIVAVIQEHGSGQFADRPGLQQLCRLAALGNLGLSSLHSAIFQSAVISIYEKRDSRLCSL